MAMRLAGHAPWVGLRTGFSIYLFYMAQEYPAVRPYHSVASADR
eukprot:SAG31_NODE_2727_length_5181_cov_7.977568_1_plen_43_part_10